MHALKIAGLQLEYKMNQFYLIGLYDLAQKYCAAASLIWEMLTEEEYNQI
jgi:hypothetical protein